MLEIQQVKVDGYESVYHASNPEIFFNSYIAIHSTKLGPALGGCRIMNYDSDESALNDVLRLAEGMAYKNSLAGLNLGGGKAVINLNYRHKTEAILKEFGTFVNFFNGKYLTAEDVGSTVADMEIVRSKTEFVESLNGSGDPSPVTAYGVFKSIQATVFELFGIRDLTNIRIAVQGLGKVGFDLTQILHAAGALLTVADVNPMAIERVKDLPGIKIVDNTEIIGTDCDIFAPCALGAVINRFTINDLRCRAICGAANNQLGDPTMGIILLKKGILYAPDYVVNAGGVINIYPEITHIKYDRDIVIHQVDDIYHRLLNIFNISRETKTPTNIVADNLAKERINAVR
jgi:leucine dehydrogenase